MAQSTRPSTLIINKDEEYVRLENVLEELREVIKEKEVIVSIDSFTLDSGIGFGKSVYQNLYITTY